MQLGRVHAQSFLSSFVCSRRVVIVSVIGVKRSGMIIAMISPSTSRHRHPRLTDFRQRLVSE
jgi:hypothetical protein